jgi:hypothetical protein
LEELEGEKKLEPPLPKLNEEERELEYQPKKIYRLKEDQAFSLSLELGRREKVAWCRFPPSLCRRGWRF